MLSNTYKMLADALQFAVLIPIKLLSTKHTVECDDIHNLIGFFEIW